MVLYVAFKHACEQTFVLRSSGSLREAPQHVLFGKEALLFCKTIKEIH